MAFLLPLSFSLFFFFLVGRDRNETRFHTVAKTHCVAQAGLKLLTLPLPNAPITGMSHQSCLPSSPFPDTSVLETRNGRFQQWSFTYADIPGSKETTGKNKLYFYKRKV